MSENLEFTRNYSDESTNQGFQFEFYCDRCGNGFRTRFRPSVTGTVSGAMEAANSLFGGIFGKAADVSEQVRSSGWEKAHDDAFKLRWKSCARLSSNAHAVPSGCAVKAAGTRKKDCARNARPTWAWRWQPRNPAAQWRRFGRTRRWRKKTAKCCRRRVGGRACAPPARAAMPRWRPTPSSAPSAAPRSKAPGASARSAGLSSNRGQNFARSVGRKPDHLERSRHTGVR